MIERTLKDFWGLLAWVLRIAAWVLILRLFFPILIPVRSGVWSAYGILPFEFPVGMMGFQSAEIVGYLIFICILLVLASSLRRASASAKEGVPKRKRKCKHAEEEDEEDLEEARMMQEIYSRLFKMDERVEALETLLLERYGKELNK